MRVSIHCDSCASSIDRDCSSSTPATPDPTDLLPWRATFALSLTDSSRALRRVRLAAVRRGVESNLVCNTSPTMRRGRFSTLGRGFRVSQDQRCRTAQSSHIGRRWSPGRPDDPARVGRSAPTLVASLQSDRRCGRWSWKTSIILAATPLTIAALTAIAGANTAGSKRVSTGRLASCSMPSS